MPPCDAPIGATQRVGSSDETAWIRYYPQMRDLIRTLQTSRLRDLGGLRLAAGVGRRLGQAASASTAHTRSGSARSSGTARSFPTSRAAARSETVQDAIMTYINGKRCWINKVIGGNDRRLGAEARAVGQAPGPRGRRCHHRRPDGARRHRRTRRAQPQQAGADVPRVLQPRQALGGQPDVHPAAAEVRAPATRAPPRPTREPTDRQGRSARRGKVIPDQAGPHPRLTRCGEVRHRVPGGYDDHT